MTDAEQRSVLAVLRCLDDSGFRVTAVGWNWGAPGLWSTAAGRRRLTPRPACDLEGFITAIESIACHDRHEILIPGTDASLLAVSRARDRLSQHVRLGLPAAQVVEQSLDKAYVGRLAARVDLTPPRSTVCRSVDDVIVAGGKYGYPVLVKPQQTVAARDGALCRWASVFAEEPGVAAVAAARFGPCIVEALVPGHVISFGGVAAGRGLIAFAVSRYRRTWPPQSGNVCFSETVPTPPGLAERVEALTVALGWQGMFELELIQRLDGSFSAIDFNPRAYGSLALAVAAGVPLPALWCSWLLGQRPASTQARPGARYRWEDADVRHLSWQLRAHDIGQALRVMRPHRRVVHAYFRLRDPVPSLVRLIELGRIGGSRRRGRGRSDLIR